MMIPVLMSASPELVDKVLRRDLDKQLKAGAYVLQELTEKNQTNGVFYKVEVSGILHAYIYTGRVVTHRSTSAPQSGMGKWSEYFDYYIQFDSNLVVQQVKIIRYAATHGHAISSPGWLRRFRGYKPGQPLEVGMQVDAISGATLSVNAITFDIRKNSSILRKLVRGN